MLAILEVVASLVCSHVALVDLKELNMQPVKQFTLGAGYIPAFCTNKSSHKPMIVGRTLYSIWQDMVSNFA